MFKKWTSLENHYQMKHIVRFFDKNPELWKESFLVTEKIDGANMSIVFYPDGHKEFNKRSGKAGDGFFNYMEAFSNPDIELFVNSVQNHCVESGQTLQLVGELYGPGINGRVWYGDKKRWRWYAIYEHMSDGSVTLLSVNEQEDLMDSICFSWRYFYIPDIGLYSMADTWERFIETIDIRIPSLLTPKEYIGHEKGGVNNLIEGIVIRPYEKDYYTPVGAAFIIKYKNPEYMDGNIDKKVRKRVVISEDLQKIIDIGLGMVNENRTLDLFSKEGELEDMKEFGKYIKLYVQDVFDDFMKNEENKETYSSLEKKEQKIFNKSITGKISGELKKYM